MAWFRTPAPRPRAVLLNPSFFARRDDPILDVVAARAAEQEVNKSRRQEVKKAEGVPDFSGPGRAFLCWRSALTRSITANESAASTVRAPGWSCRTGYTCL
jgi:hypothetical protein